MSPIPSASPVTSTKTRSGSTVVVTRTDDVLPGYESLVSVMAGNCEILNFTPATALELAGMLARAAAATVAVRIKVTNSYPTESFEHLYDVTVPAPLAGEYDLHDWCYEHLYEHTGEGPDYASVPAMYEVEIVSAPVHFEYLVGLKVDSYG